MKHIYNALIPLYQNLGLEKKFALHEIISRWHIIFGSPFSNHTCPVDLKDGELIINVDSPAWLQQLKFMQPLIIEKLNSYAIKSVKLRIGRIKKDKVKKDSAITLNPFEKTYVISTEDAEWLNDALSIIKDSEIKEIITKIIPKSISYTTKNKDSI